MAYFDTKSGSLEEAIRQAVGGQINEKVTEYIELEFKDKQAAINAYNTINRKVYPGGTQPFSDINQEGNTIQLDKVDNSKKVLADFKKVGKLKFKVAVEEKLDPVNKKALKKDFDDRKDKDIDNDGDVDDSDEYLAKRRKAVSKAIAKEETIQAQIDKAKEFKIQDMKSALAQVWGMEEGKNPFKKEEEEKPVITKGGKTLTGKKPAEIDVKPKINKEA